MLSYEQELRTAAYRYIRDGKCKDLRAALEKACDAPEVLTTHFVVPFTLGKVEDSVDMPDLARVPWLRHGKGGKGKGGGKAAPDIGTTVGEVQQDSRWQSSVLQVQQGMWLLRSFLPFCACVLALLREAFFPEVQVP